MRTRAAIPEAMWTRRSYTLRICQSPLSTVKIGNVAEQITHVGPLKPKVDVVPSFILRPPQGLSLMARWEP